MQRGDEILQKHQIEATRPYLDDILALPPSGFHVSQILGGMRLLGILILAVVGIGVLLLVEVPKGVVDLSVLALVGAN
jgi:hypothetical protein